MATTSKINALHSAAHVLYHMGVSGKEIARICEVSENTVSTWAQKGNWREERANAMARNRTMQSRLLNLIDYQLESLEIVTQKNRDAETIVPLDKGEIDALAKMFAQIKGKELTWAAVVTAVRDFQNYLALHNPDLARLVVPHCDAYLVAKRETLS